MGGNKMYIKRVELEDFLVFRNEFALNFCPGVNVFIGGNGTGKTTLLKMMYRDFEVWLDSSLKPKADIIFSDDQVSRLMDGYQIRRETHGRYSLYIRTSGLINCYIPEKDILEHAKGLLPFIMQKETGFGQIYRDVLIAAQDVPTQKQSETQKSVGERISAIIGGEVLGTKATVHFTL